MGRIHVLVVDDHRILAEAPAAALSAEPDADVGAAADASAAERAPQRAAAEDRGHPVLPVDADPAGTVDGTGSARRSRAARPEPRTVAPAAQDDPCRAARAPQAGAAGRGAEDRPLRRPVAVVRGVPRDETHVPPASLTGVVREPAAARRDRTGSERPVDSLTARHKQVLRRTVADRPHLPPHTVRTPRHNVLGKLGVHPAPAAAASARQAGVGPAEAVAAG